MRRDRSIDCRCANIPENLGSDGRKLGVCGPMPSVMRTARTIAGVSMTADIVRHQAQPIEAVDRAGRRAARSG